MRPPHAKHPAMAALRHEIEQQLLIWHWRTRNDHDDGGLADTLDVDVFENPEPTVNTLGEYESICFSTIGHFRCRSPSLAAHEAAGVNDRMPSNADAAGRGRLARRAVHIPHCE